MKAGIASKENCGMRRVSVPSSRCTTKYSDNMLAITITSPLAQIAAAPLLPQRISGNGQHQRGERRQPVLSWIHCIPSSQQPHHGSHVRSPVLRRINCGNAGIIRTAQQQRSGTEDAKCQRGEAFVV